MFYYRKEIKNLFSRQINTINLYYWNNYYSQMKPKLQGNGAK